MKFGSSPRLLGQQPRDHLGSILDVGHQEPVLQPWRSLLRRHRQVDRVLGRLLFETRPLDPATYTAASVFLLAVALLACVLPAWRATRVSLVTALRNE